MSLRRSSPASSTSRMNSKRTMRTFAGLATARGLVSGPACLYRGAGELVVPEYRIAPGDEQLEIDRLRIARRQTRRDLEGLIAVLRDRTSREDVQVFECHLLILEDPMLISGAERYISVEHYNAAAATRRVTDEARAQFERMNDPYFRERVRDLDDVERRLLTAILGTGVVSPIDLKTPSVIIASDLTPSETVRLPRDLVLGFATDGGSTTSHVALLARALGIPAVTGLGDITARVEPGETVLLDGTNGAVTVCPDEPTLDEFRKLEARQQANRDAVLEGPPAGTLADGGEVLLYANIHPGIPLAGVREFGARGIGLYRSEYLWLSRELEPTEEEQFVAYRDAAKFASTLSSGATITIRTLDIGGDKTVRGITAKESNPFLGNRSIRYLLSHPEVFRTQLRAILRASAHGPVCVMYPMVSCVEEMAEAATILEEVKRDLSGRGVPFDENIPVGAMIEVPAAAINADALARYVRFFSIGTNDLVQYAMAADRSNEAVANLYQPTNPAVLWLVRHVVEAAKRNGVYVSVCGESAADPVEGVLWAAMGVDLLSMSSGFIPVISALLRRLTRQDLAEYAAYVCSFDATHRADEIYNAARAWLKARIADFEELSL